MNDGRSFSFPGLNSKRNSPDPAFTDLIELLPLGAVLIDARTHKIEAANARFVELARTSAPDLVGREVDALLPGWESGSSALLRGILHPDGKPSEAAELYSETLPLARISSVPALPKGKRILMIEIRVPGTSSPAADHIARYWAGLLHLILTLQESELSTALDQATNVVQKLLEAEEVAVYRLASDQPVLRCCTPLRENSTLPDEITAQDMVSLNRPRLWETGKRPTGDLHRRARADQMAYVASAPIGQERAIIGLLVACSRKPPSNTPFVSAGIRPADTLLPAIHTLATVFTLIFERHVWLDNVNQQRSEQERRLRLEIALANNSLEGLVVLDADLRISRLNAAAELMFGYAGSEVIGHVVEKMLIGPEALQPALNAAQQGSPTYNLGNVHLYRRNGEAFLALVRIFPVVSAGTVENVLLLVQDLSEQEQVHLQTQQLEQRALLGEVTAVFAHEVRNPVNNISTSLQYMAMNLSEDDSNQAAIARMLQDCDRLTELLKSVLAFSKPTDYEMEPVDLTGLLRRLLERLHPRIVRQNVHYDLRTDESCPRVIGNPRALEQVFNNLIGNALQAMGEAGGHLILKACPVREDGQNYLEVSVADTGPGIPKELQERVFQIFFTTEKGGTGLGLAIVKRIVTAHKGLITLESFPGGTIFRVRIPTE